MLSIHNFLKFILEEKISESTLDFIRIFISASTQKEPRNFPRKLLYFILIFAVFAFNMCIQSDLSAISTVSNRIPVIDSVEDLIGSDLTIYGTSNFKELIWDEEIRRRYNNIENFSECTHRFSKNEHVACIFVGSFIQFYFYENQTIHISRTNVVERFGTYVLGEDSPFSYKLNYILLRMTEGGLVELFGRREERYFPKNRDKNESETNLNLAQLFGEFSILILGWIISLLTFLMEMSFKTTNNILIRK